MSSAGQFTTRKYVETPESGRLSAVRSFLGVGYLLEQYFERELNLAFRLSGAGKQAEVGIRYSVVRLRRTLKRAKGCLVPGIEEVRSKVDTSSLFAEWKHLLQR